MKKGVFIRYSFRYILLARSRQKLLLLAFFGLFLSCFALLILQSTMGGLQRNLQERSQFVVGHGEFLLGEEYQSDAFSKKIQGELQSRGIQSFREYELELLVRRGAYVSPLIIHGVDWEERIPPFLEELNRDGIILGRDGVRKMKGMLGDEIQLISPSHLDPLLGGMPRQLQETVGDVISTGTPELDLFHGWVRGSFLHNMMYEVRYNKIRHYGEASHVVPFLLKKYGAQLSYSSWEQINQALVWALGMESTLMLVLFVGMTLLVAISITSGLFIFYQKIQREMLGFWILGASEGQLRRSYLLFLHCLAMGTCLLSLVCALGFLTLLDHWSPEVMPDIFVDRKIPVEITWEGVLISVFVPYGVAIFFAHFSMIFWKGEGSQRKLAYS